MVLLDRDKFEKLQEAPILGNGEPPVRLTAKAFELLEGLFQEPTGDHYAERKDDFQRWLETPFRDLMAQVIGRLPTEVTERMETEKNLFGRIRKNDYGRGGAWPFYWGALYPKGNRRTEAAQLILSINSDRLEAGFDMGENDDAARERFLTQAARHRDRLTQMLGPVLDRPDLVFGDRHEDEQGRLRAEETPTWSEWLNAPGDYGIDVVRVFPRNEVVRRPTEELAEEIAQLYSDLFPLVLLSLSDNPLPEIRRHVADPGVDDTEPEINQPYPLADCAAKLKMSSDTLGRWVRAIHRKGQAILYGPPGTGKTYAAEHLADHLIGGGDGFRELVQFHPSYAYEDFIQGIRPAAHSGGGLDYPVRPGRFLEFCERAARREGICVLIVDEINRANLSRVFGELMYLLENRGEVIHLAADGQRFSIPENVRLLGTMNTADRSIALVDHALRRRFAFLALRPDYETLKRYHAETDSTYDPKELVTLLEEVNQAIDDPHYEVGITYFLLKDLAGEIEDVWRMEIVPYLEEYFADRPDVVDRFRWKSVQERLSG